MYIEMKKMGLDVSDLIALVQRKRGGNTGFPYKDFVCCCSNCRYSTKSKCALKECCCMNERICAHTCTFGEMMRYCFSNIGDNVFRFRLRIGMAYRKSTYSANEYDMYLFVKNVKGDVTSVIDEDGTTLVTCVYNAWGKIVSQTYANGGASTAVVYNPFRYRGYYYDSETGLYYVSSRYYDPEIGRWINADAVIGQITPDKYCSITFSLVLSE